jgi:hypothetical protein
MVLGWWDRVRSSTTGTTKVKGEDGRKGEKARPRGGDANKAPAP